MHRYTIYLLIAIFVAWLLTMKCMHDMFSMIEMFWPFKGGEETETDTNSIDDAPDNRRYIRANGKKWYVQSEDSIPLLSEMINRINQLIQEIQKHPQPTYSLVRLRPWDSSFVTENKFNSWKYHSTAYSVNKGDELVFCLRDTNNQLHDINTMMFVAIHELAHIVTDELQHTDKFWKNMQLLIDQAEYIGVYEPVDYKFNATEYCGVTIDQTP